MIAVPVCTAAPLRSVPASSLRLFAWPHPDPMRYRAVRANRDALALVLAVALADEALLAIVHDAAIEVHAVVDRSGIEVGMLELDRYVPEACEIACFGLIPELAGKGHGRWLMAEVLAPAWSPGVVRLRINSCTLDQPGALGFYRHQGFTPVRRTLETSPDPRLLGLVPADAAPQIPSQGLRRRR